MNEVDILYVSHNRLEFTKASFRALLANTDWDQVGTLYVMDDGSTDGTREWLEDQACIVPPAVVAFSAAPFGGPVAAMNRYLAVNGRARAEAFAKVDNDLLVPPGWLGTMAGVLDRNPELGILGMAAGWTGEPEGWDGVHTWTPASHIGGVGLIRRSVFEGRPRMEPARRFFGWSEFQTADANQDILRGWVTPPIDALQLDLLPFEPWASLTAEYVAKGWQRKWPPYQAISTALWEWAFPGPQKVVA